MFTSATGRLQPIWSFFLSAAFSVAAFVVCAFVAGALTRDHVLRFEAIFRPLLCVALCGIYLWLLTVADQLEEHRVAALGFPLAPGWKRQFAAGCVLWVGTDLPGGGSPGHLVRHHTRLPVQLPRDTARRHCTRRTDLWRLGGRDDVSWLSLSTAGGSDWPIGRNRSLFRFCSAPSISPIQAPAHWGCSIQFCLASYWQLRTCVPARCGSRGAFISAGTLP